MVSDRQIKINTIDVMLILGMDKKGHKFKVCYEPWRPLCPKEDDSVLKKKS